MAQLVFSRGQTPYFRVILHLSSTKMGRASHCDIVLSDPEVSREHAVVYLLEGQYLIKKLGNALVKVNGKEIESKPLLDQDKISIGPWESIFSLQVAKIAQEEETEGAHYRHEKTQAVACGSQGLMTQEISLVVQGPSEPVRTVSLHGESITVGASEKNDIVIGDPFVSSRHLKIIRRDGRIFIYDVGSTNGTFINGVRVKDAELEVGFTVKLGEYQLSLQVTDKLESNPQVEVDKFYGLVGSSKVMQGLYGILQRVGPADATILILGESGTGKELVARAVHSLSSRANAPFVAINCGAISPELIESELFGHEKGAFTGAQRQHDGAFGQASGGTLFLDEIGELPLELQPKLLRVLENKTYRRIGGSAELNANVRIVAATHRDLTAGVQEKKFREDLFFRLFVLPVFLPPLRQRKDDILLLCKTFLEEFSTGSSVKKLGADASIRLLEYPFPGNIRELKNVLLRSVILSKGETIGEEELLFLEDLKTPSELPAFQGASLEKLEEMERRLVLKALTAHQWNKAKAAEALGVAKSTLFAKIKLYGLEEPKN